METYTTVITHWRCGT